MEDDTGVEEEIVLIVILSVSGVIDDVEEEEVEDFLSILGGGVLCIVDGDSERRRPLGSGGLPCGGVITVCRDCC